MKLAISTLGCPDWSFCEALRAFQSMGIRAMEVRGIDGELDADKITWFMPEKAQETKAMLRKHGVTMIGFGSSVRFDDETEFDRWIAQGKREIDICQAMEIPVIRVFGNDIRDKAHPETTINLVAQGLRMLCEYTADKHVTVCLEVHGDFNCIETLEPVIRALKDCPSFGIIWDIAHSDRAYGDDYMAFYQLIRPHIRHVHIKDHIRGEHGGLCLPGEGDIPVGEIVQLLLSDGYDGYFSFEWEKKWHPQLAEPEEAFPAFIKYMNGR